MGNNSDLLLKVKNLWKTFGDVVAAREVTFDVPRGTMISLLGPSGCGKTTTLRCVAGLESPSAGEIVIGGETVTDVAKGIEVPPEKRSIGMVFQSYAVWPHMTVFQNVAFPLKLRRKEGQGSIEERVHKTLTLVGLEDFAERPATNLSGGQQQRVALARALVAEPELVLFDEPLSNLDAKLREYMRVELLALQRRLGFTAVYVTHDQQEALTLSDELIIMKDGLIVQQGTPQDIYRKPRTTFVADFMGASNMMKGKIVGKKDALHVVVELEEAGTKVICSVNSEKALKAQGAAAIVSFRPERTNVIPQTGPGSNPPGEEDFNRIPSQVEAVLFMGEFFEYSAKTAEVRLKARSRALQALPVETPIYVTVAPENCLAIPEEESANDDRVRKGT